MKRASGISLSTVTLLRIAKDLEDTKKFNKLLASIPEQDEMHCLMSMIAAVNGNHSV